MRAWEEEGVGWVGGCLGAGRKAEVARAKAASSLGSRMARLIGQGGGIGTFCALRRPEGEGEHDMCDGNTFLNAFGIRHLRHALWCNLFCTFRLSFAEAFPVQSSSILRICVTFLQRCSSFWLGKLCAYLLELRLLLNSDRLLSP